MLDDPELERRLEEAFPFLPGCEPGFLQELRQAAMPVRLERDAFICHQGSACGSLALVLEGAARIYKLGESGREITLYRVGRGESCVLTASCILSDLPFPAFAVCEEPIEAVAVPAGAARRWLADSAGWRHFLFDTVARRLSEVITLVEEVAFRRMDSRIADYLLRRAELGGDPSIHCTHQEIASDLGTSREVVTRILKDLESRGLLRTARGSLVLLDPQRLARFSDPRSG
jgi:CRP/FNR family transcriptional regulator, anaerobic regulatory protein